MLSLSTGSGVQVGFGCTGDVMLPSRIDVGKHSRITAMGYKFKITRNVISSGDKRDRKQVSLILLVDSQESDPEFCQE